VSRKTVLGLMLIAFAGVGLRAIGLDTQSLWNDELLIWERTNAPSVSVLIAEGADHGSLHPPGYMLTIYYARTLLGDSERALRLPSLIAGVLSIVAIFFLGRRLYADREALVASGLMALLWAPIYYSQEARSYSFLILFSILTSHAWLATFARAGSIGRGAALLYVPAAIYCSYLHYFGLYLVALQGVAALLWFGRDRRSRLAVVTVYLPIVAVYVPWLPAMIHDTTSFDRGFDNIKPPQSMFVVDLVRFWFNRSRPLLPLAALIYALFLVRRAPALLRGDGGRPDPYLWPDRFVLAWLTVPVVLIVAESALYRPVANERNLLIVLPAAYLWMARALTDLPHRLSRGEKLLAQAFLMLCLLQLLVVKDYYRKPTKQQYRQAIEYIAEHDPDFPRTWVAASGGRAKYLDYYLRRQGFRDGARGIDSVSGLEAMAVARPGGAFWWVDASRTDMQKGEIFAEVGAREVFVRRFHKVVVRRFELPAAES